MEILEKIEIIELGLFFDETLVISDVHIGYEESINRQGIMLPRQQFEDIIKRLERIFKKLEKRRIGTIVVNGDLKDQFGGISEQEWRNTLKFLDFLSRHAKRVIIVKGNHDAVLEPIARKRNIPIVDYYTKSDKIVLHGDKIADEIKNYKTIIIGHEHPAVSLKDGPRMETYKCFLKGKFNRKNLIVMPSFNSIVAGTDLFRDSILSPFLKKNLDNFEIFVVEDEIYDFGKLKNLRARLKNSG